MCGRYTLTTSLPELVEVFEVPDPDFEYPPRYNIAPTQSAPVVAWKEEERRMGLLRWGLVPSWAKEPAMGSRLINARSETVEEKPAFRQAFRRRRCLIPADGFFEWRKGEKKGRGSGPSTPFWIHFEDRTPFAMAGLWERWAPPEGAPLFTFTILTVPAAEPLRRIHHRMPAILLPTEWDVWLDPDAEADSLKALLRPLEDEHLVADQVSRAVNSPANDSPSVIQPVG